MSKRTLIENLRNNAGAILEILQAHGVDVERYKPLAKELEEKQRNKQARARERGKIYRENNKNAPTTILYNFTTIAKRQSEKEKILTLKAFIDTAEEKATALQSFIRTAKTTETMKRWRADNAEKMREYRRTYQSKQKLKEQEQ